MMSWLVDMGTELTATLPTPTRVPTMTEPGGTILAALSAIALSVIHSTAASWLMERPFKATVPIHGMVP